MYDMASNKSVSATEEEGTEMQREKWVLRHRKIQWRDERHKILMALEQETFIAIFHHYISFPIAPCSVHVPECGIQLVRDPQTHTLSQPAFGHSPKLIFNTVAKLIYLDLAQIFVSTAYFFIISNSGTHETVQSHLRIPFPQSRAW